MTSTILLTIIIFVLIYRCYKMETDLINLKIKHNELTKIVSNNAVVLKNTTNIVDGVVEKINQILEYFYNEKGDMIDEN